jgi:hypothetical protein
LLLLLVVTQRRSAFLRRLCFQRRTLKWKNLIQVLNNICFTFVVALLVSIIILIIVSIWNNIILVIIKLVNICYVIIENIVIFVWSLSHFFSITWWYIRVVQNLINDHILCWRLLLLMRKKVINILFLLIVKNLLIALRNW